MAKPKTPTQKEYERIRKNLLRQKKKLEKEGFTFEKEPVPPKPKKITAASVRKIKAAKESLSEKATIKYNGERLTARQYRNVKRWESAKKGAETRKRRRDQNKPPKPPIPPEEPKDTFADVVINNYLADLEKWKRANKEKVRKNAGRVEDWIQNLLDNNDKEAVARMIEEGAQNGLILTFEILYNDDYTDMYMTEMIRFFPGMTGEERDKMREDIAEESDDFTDIDDIELDWD